MSDWLVDFDVLYNHLTIYFFLLACNSCKQHKGPIQRIEFVEACTYIERGQFKCSPNRGSVRHVSARSSSLQILPPAYLRSNANNAGGDSFPVCGDRADERRHDHCREEKDVGGMPNSPATARG